MIEEMISQSFFPARKLHSAYHFTSEKNGSFRGQFLYIIKHKNMCLEYKGYIIFYL